MQLTDAFCKFDIVQTVKKSKPGRHIEPLRLKAYAPDRRLCVITYIKEYISRTQAHRDSNQFLLSFTKPYKPVTKETVNRWVKSVMQTSGINTEVFHPHSVRAASTSAANKAGCPLVVILKAAGWSNSNTFAKYYNKEITKKQDSFDVAILDMAE